MHRHAGIKCTDMQASSVQTCMHAHTQTHAQICTQVHEYLHTHTQHTCSHIRYMHLHLTFIYSSTRRAVGAPQMTSQQVSSILFLFSTALWELKNSRPIYSLMLSSKLFFCLPCLLPHFTVPCKTVWAQPKERETYPYLPRW